MMSTWEMREEIVKIGTETKAKQKQGRTQKHKASSQVVDSKSRLS